MYTITSTKTAPENRVNPDAPARWAGALLIAAFLYRHETFLGTLESIGVRGPEDLESVFAMLDPEQQAAVQAVAAELKEWLD